MTRYAVDTYAPDEITGQLAQTGTRGYEERNDQLEYLDAWRDAHQGPDVSVAWRAPGLVVAMSTRQPVTVVGVVIARDTDDEMLSAAEAHRLTYHPDPRALLAELQGRELRRGVARRPTLRELQAERLGLAG